MRTEASTNDFNSVVAMERSPLYSCIMCVEVLLYTLNRLEEMTIVLCVWYMPSITVSICRMEREEKSVKNQTYA